MGKVTALYNRAKELFSYDSKSGNLIRKLSVSPNARKGDVAGYVRCDGYVQVKIDHKAYKAHRIIWLLKHKELPEEIDHVNGDRSDNRMCNLRATDRAGNTQNRRRFKSNTTGFKGVSVQKSSGKYLANIGLNGKLKYLGTFSTPEEAHAAYCAAGKKHYGEFFRGD